MEIEDGDIGLKRQNKESACGSGWRIRFSLGSRTPGILGSQIPQLEGTFCDGYESMPRLAEP